MSTPSEIGDTEAERDLVVAYKSILRQIIDSRPSGMRLKIARALGKHKSFVSQITNPAYAIPVPVRHVEKIFEICHFARDERDAFLEAYRRAHPNRAEQLRDVDSGDRPLKSLTLELPLLEDPDRQAALEDLIRDFAARVTALAERR